MRNYELMVILDPNLDERTVTPSLETFLRVITTDGGTVEKMEVWGKRRMAYEINKHAEGIYAVLDVRCEPATVAELDRQLSLNESVLRTKVMRREINPRKANAAAKARAAAAHASNNPRPSSAPSGPSGPRTASASGPRPGAPTPGPSAPASAPASTESATPAPAAPAPAPPAPVN
jgi:small subunit ribosomal protein S6